MIWLHLQSSLKIDASSSQYSVICLEAGLQGVTLDLSQLGRNKGWLIVPYEKDNHFDCDSLKTKQGQLEIDHLSTLMGIHCHYWLMIGLISGYHFTKFL